MNAQYPIGPFVKPSSYSLEEVKQWIEDIRSFPRLLKQITHQLSTNQLDTPYRKNGWTVRQVVHHVADSHMNAFIRFKLALTEDFPLIKTYDEKKWATLSDCSLPIEASVKMVEGIHERWYALIKEMDETDFHRTMNHPEYADPQPLYTNLGLYSWHGRHHLSHIGLVAHAQKA